MKEFAIPKYLNSFLAQPWEVILSTVGRKGIPQQTVMWYRREGHQITMTCLEKRVKVGNLRADPRASVLVVGPGCYASFQGEVSIDDDLELAQSNLEALVRRYVSGDVENMVARMTDPTRVTLHFKPHRCFSHRVRAWSGG